MGYWNGLLYWADPIGSTHLIRLGLYIGLAQNGSTHLNGSSIFILIKLNWVSFGLDRPIWVNPIPDPKLYILTRNYTYWPDLDFMMGWNPTHNPTRKNFCTCAVSPSSSVFFFFFFSPAPAVALSTLPPYAAATTTQRGRRLPRNQAALTGRQFQWRGRGRLQRLLPSGTTPALTGRSLLHAAKTRLALCGFSPANGRCYGFHGWFSCLLPPYEAANGNPAGSPFAQEPGGP
jgi:hypothetical protein